MGATAPQVCRDKRACKGAQREDADTGLMVAEFRFPQETNPYHVALT
jgi:hypothetical protein